MTTSDEKILVSAIITTYKRKGEVLKRALDSILSQSYSPIEIIVVDDNREDEEGERHSKEAAEVVSKGPGVILVKTEGGRHGAQAARNTGIHVSKGEYLAFLDDDDEWCEKKIEKQVALLAAHPEAGMCFCRGIRFNENFDPPYINDFHGRGFKSEVSYKELLRSDSIGTTSQAMIRRKAFEMVGEFDETLPARQDYEMWLRISSKFNVVGVDEQLFVHRISKGDTQISKSWDKCIEGHTKLYNKYKTDIDKDRHAKFNVLFYLAHYNMQKRDWPVSIKYYLSSFFVSPLDFLDKGILKIQSLKKRK